ncbi:hypothetical protein HSBGL_1584 [Halapricum desulfuricans]|uniref:Uncharacterized protein n=1 Tax=Halapricum desulfuricans TaxID=2841257 RepID=A0A897NI35_9EURY|nr:hypothetical protein HSBGL_1584 [Halapricum desulfuricans]
MDATTGEGYCGGSRAVSVAIQASGLPSSVKTVLSSVGECADTDGQFSTASSGVRVSAIAVD